MKLCVIVYLILAVLFVCLILTNKKEGFTTHYRDGLLCQPFLNNREACLMPDSVVFLVQGYNYRDTPKIFRDGQLVVPLQYAWDYGAMAYYLVIKAPNGLCGSDWTLETTDFVKPVVHEARTGKVMNVTLERRRYDYNKWNLSC